MAAWISWLGELRNAAAFLMALGLALYFTPTIRRAALNYGVLDQPDGALKQHAEPTPYLGGIAVYLAFLFAVAFTYQFTRQVLAILLGASIVVQIGLFDDLKVLGPWEKLGGQLVAALVLVKAGILIRLTFLPDWAAILLSIFWLIAATNAINLLDVSDGLASGVVAIAGGFFYAFALINDAPTIAVMLASLVGATLGFLAFNRPPARIFLGDTGSMFLGFMLAAVSMIGQYTFKHKLGALAPLIILGVPIFDMVFVVAERMRRRIPIMRGSPDHFAVRLRNRGVSAGRIAVVGYLSSFLLGGCALLLCFSSPDDAYLILGGVLFLGLVAAIGLIRLGR